MATALEYIFISGIFVYLLGAVFSIIFNRKDSLANNISNSLSILASSIGILFSVQFLFGSNLFNTEIKNVLSFGFKTNVAPFIINFRLDNLSVFFILIISILSLIVSIYSTGYLKHYYNKRNLGYFGFLYNLFILSMILVVTSGQMFFFLIVWEVMSMVSYFLVVYEGEKPETQRAGVMYVVMTHIGTAFIIAAFILIYKYCGTADFGAIDGSKIPNMIKNLIFIFILIGFGTKAGIIPLHVWLPMAHPAAPSNISALMSGLMIKTAVYGIIRIVFGVLGVQYLWWGTIILILGAVSTVLGIAYALMDINIKKLLAYSSVENMGIIFMGLGLSIIANSAGNHMIAALSITAALLHVFNHSIFKGLLFMGAGSIHYATNTKNMEKLGGLIKRLPVTAVFFLTGALAISAIPPFNGFVSEWLTYQSLFVNVSINDNWLKIIIILVVAALAMAGVLAAFSFIKTFGIAFLALPRSKEAEEAKEVPKSMLVGMGIPAVLCLLSGLLPITLIKVLDKINLQFLNTSILKDIKGAGSFLTYPVTINKSSFSPLILLVFGLVVFAVLFYILAFGRIKTAKRKYGTWDCGYKALNSDMQYSATGFSKPIRIVFRALLRPQRELELDSGSSPYFIKSGTYSVSIQSVFEKYIYMPIIKNIIKFALKARYLIQTGSIHTYLIYIFIVILCMLVYYIKS